MYYLTQQKHKTAVAKEKKLEELSQFSRNVSRNSSLGAHLDRVSGGAAGDGAANQGQQQGGGGVGGSTDGGQTRASNPKPVPIQPGVLPTRPEAQAPSNTNNHGRPGSILRTGTLSILTITNDDDQRLNLNLTLNLTLTTSQPFSTGGNDTTTHNHPPAEGGVGVDVPTDIVPDLTQFIAKGNSSVHAVNNAHNTIAANRRGPLGASFRQSFNVQVNPRASVDATGNGTNLGTSPPRLHHILPSML